MNPRRALTRLVAVFAMGGLALTSIPVSAQDNSDARIRKLESEVRALQRRVFPGSDGRFFEPEITPGEAATRTTGAASTTAVTDILARLDALEGQIQRLTSQTEVNTNALSLLDTRLAALEVTTVAAGAETGVGAGTPAATQNNMSAMTGGASSTPAASAPAAAATGPSATRLAAVQTIAKPQTDDPADDEYSYGFRLWEAKFYPEAQQQLTMFVEKYPSHWRATYGRNLLGRAYLDDGKPGEAAPWFLRNYQADKSAARSGDSLLFLGETMIAMDDTSRACIALAEFGDTYPALATGRLQSQYEAARKRVTCN
ncbi:tetratricopeptide repeat protein [Alteripontixanthobacter maritimus]|nr:hypothetical protein [Alteripontixanthobacter maritimus]